MDTVTVFVLVITIMYSDGRTPQRTEISGYRTYTECIRAANRASISADAGITVSTFCETGT